MAKDPSKTEEATPKHIDEARSDGNVLVSQDVSAIITTVGGTYLLILTFAKLHDIFVKEMNNISILFNSAVVWNGSEMILLLQNCLVDIAVTLALPLVGVTILGIAGMRVQTGAYFYLKPLTWKISSLDPIKGFKQVLPNKQNIMKLLLSLGKVAVVGILIYFTLNKDLQTIINLPLSSNLEMALGWVKGRAIMLVVKILLFFVIIAALDYLFRRKEYFENLKMSKHEVKDEMKNSEGDPLVKSKLRQKMHDLTKNRLVNEIPEADVVITNPIHVAVVLKYEMGAVAPKVIAKGLRKRALLIKKMAKEHGVPIIENPTLARGIYRHVPAGSYISSDFFNAVAIILAKLQKQGRRNFTSSKN